MKIKANVSFAGEVIMAPGEEKDVPDAIGKDLVAAGYAEEVGGKKPAADKQQKPEPKTEPKKAPAKKK